MGIKKKKSALSENVTPKYLNWKCIDNFDQVPDDEIFYIGKIKLTPKERDVLRPIFEDIRRRWTRTIKEAFSKRPKHLTIAGGNYTYFLVLPKLIQWAREKHPFLSIRLKLLETREGPDLSWQDADIVLAGVYMDAVDTQEVYRQILKAGYTYSRYYYDDETYLAASKDSVEEFGSEEATLKKHNILFGKLWRASDASDHKEYLYTTAPEGREHEEKKIVVDLWYMGYLFMKRGAGIWHVFKSMKRDPNLVILTPSVSKIRRFFVYKKGLDRKYKDLGRILMNSLYNKGG